MTGGNATVSGTIGQVDAGNLSGATFDATGGFWFELAPGDCTEDGGVETLDFSTVQACMAGPAVPVAPPCGCLDFDADGDVDLLDAAEFQVTVVAH